MVDFDLNNPELALFSIDGVPVEPMSISDSSSLSSYSGSSSEEEEQEEITHQRMSIYESSTNSMAGHKRNSLELTSSSISTTNSPSSSVTTNSKGLSTPPKSRAKSPRIEPLPFLSWMTTSSTRRKSTSSRLSSTTTSSVVNSNSTDFNDEDSTTNSSSSTDIDYSLWSLDSSIPANQKRRGRPRKSAPLKEFEEVIPNIVQFDSVKKIPCFVSGCTHAYHRPGSSIIERSDRMLQLHPEYEDYLIRSCKKHHEVWKKLSSQAENTCEICRGLNCRDEVFQKRVHSNSDSKIFRICDNCAKRQSVVLKLSSGTNM